MCQSGGQTAVLTEWWDSRDDLLASYPSLQSSAMPFLYAPSLLPLPSPLMGRAKGWVALL